MTAARKLVALALLLLLLGCAGLLLALRAVLGLFRESLESMGGSAALQTPFLFLALSCLAAAVWIMASETVLLKREKSGAPASPEQSEKWLTIDFAAAGVLLTVSGVYALFLAGTGLLALWDTQERMLQVLKRQKSELSVLRARLDAVLPESKARPEGRGRARNPARKEADAGRSAP